MDILCKVEGQRLRIETPLRHFPQGSDDFVRFLFTLSSDWNDLKIFAQFRQGVKVSNEYLTDATVTVDGVEKTYKAATLPAWPEPGLVTMMLFGTGRETVIGTTNYVLMWIDPTGFVDDCITSDLTETLYQQLINRFIQIEWSAEIVSDYKGAWEAMYEQLQEYDPDNPLMQIPAATASTLGGFKLDATDFYMGDGADAGKLKLKNTIARTTRVNALEAEVNNRAALTYTSATHLQSGDLDDILTPGTYYAMTAEDAYSIFHTPVKRAFMMHVLRPFGGEGRAYQIAEVWRSLDEDTNKQSGIFVRRKIDNSTAIPAEPPTPVRPKEPTAPGPDATPEEIAAYEEAVAEYEAAMDAYEAAVPVYEAARAEWHAKWSSWQMLLTNGDLTNAAAEVLEKLANVVSIDGNNVLFNGDLIADGDKPVFRYIGGVSAAGSGGTRSDMNDVRKSGIYYQKTSNVPANAATTNACVYAVFSFPNASADSTERVIQIAVSKAGNLVYRSMINSHAGWTEWATAASKTYVGELLKKYNCDFVADHAGVNRAQTTRNGITSTVANGVVTLSGTATEQTFVILAGSTNDIPAWVTDGKYYVNIKKSVPDTVKYQIACYQSGKYVKSFCSKSESDWFEVGGADEMGGVVCRLVIPKGATVDNTIEVEVLTAIPNANIEMMAANNPTKIRVMQYNIGAFRWGAKSTASYYADFLLAADEDNLATKLNNYKTFFGKYRPDIIGLQEYNAYMGVETRNIGHESDYVNTCDTWGNLFAPLYSHYTSGSSSNIITNLPVTKGEIWDGVHAKSNTLYALHTTFKTLAQSIADGDNVTDKAADLSDGSRGLTETGLGTIVKGGSSTNWSIATTTVGGKKVALASGPLFNGTQTAYDPATKSSCRLAQLTELVTALADYEYAIIMCDTNMVISVNGPDPETGKSYHRLCVELMQSNGYMACERIGGYRSDPHIEYVTYVGVHAAGRDTSTDDPARKCEGKVFLSHMDEYLTTTDVSARYNIAEGMVDNSNDQSHKNTCQCIDNIFVKGNIAVQGVELLAEDWESLASDHIPMIADLVIY